MEPATLNPLSILLVKKGGGGDGVLFRYPYFVPPPKGTRTSPDITPQESIRDGVSSRYVKCAGYENQSILAEDPNYPIKEAGETHLNGDTLPTISDKVLSALFAVNPNLLDKKFELKINDVRFVGHPISLEIAKRDVVFCANKRKSTLTMFHVVFALKATASHSVVQCYHDLSQQVGVAIRHEERRVGYLTDEVKTMTSAQEEVTSNSTGSETLVSPFTLALERSQLAQELKEVFENMCSSGLVHVRINNYMEVNFCMPQKVYTELNPCLSVDPASLFNCLEFLKPYHTLLLLYEIKELLDQFPLDGSPTLYRLIKAADPTMSFRNLAIETAIPLKHTLELAGYLLYWGKATVIYPVCENNVYVISPNMNNILTPVVLERFSEKFPGEKFVEMLSIFSLPTSIAQRQHFHNPVSTQVLGRIIVFFLQQHLIVQLHTYVTLCLKEDLTTSLEDPIRRKYGLPWKVARHLGDESAATGTGGIDHVVEELLMPPPCGGDLIDTVVDDSALGADLVGEEFGPMSLEMWQWAFPSETSDKPTERTGFDSSSSKGLLQASHQEEAHDDPDVILASFSDEERQIILKVSIAVTTERGLADLRLFSKLAPYFNGRYHVEEILYFANVRRSELMRILDIFSKIISTHDHEDPAVTSFYDTSLCSRN